MLLDGLGWMATRFEVRYFMIILMCKSELAPNCFRYWSIYLLSLIRSLCLVPSTSYSHLSHSMMSILVSRFILDLRDDYVSTQYSTYGMSLTTHTSSLTFSPARSSHFIGNIGASLRLSCDDEVGCGNEDERVHGPVEA